MAIDNERAVVTEARGRFNAAPEDEFDRQNLAGPGGAPAKGRLNRTDRELLGRSYRILRLWLERIAYSRFKE